MRSQKDIFGNNLSRSRAHSREQKYISSKVENKKVVKNHHFRTILQYNYLQPTKAQLSPPSTGSAIMVRIVKFSSQSSGLSNDTSA